MDVIDHRLILPLARRCHLNHVNYLVGVIEAMEEFTLELLSMINGSELEINVTVKVIAFKRTYKLFDHEVAICVDIVIGFHKMANMLANVFFSIELSFYVFL